MKGSTVEGRFEQLDVLIGSICLSVAVMILQLFSTAKKDSLARYYAPRELSPTIRVSRNLSSRTGLYTVCRIVNANIILQSAMDQVEAQIER